MSAGTENGGRVVLVTGGSRGIGRACVEAFTRAGDIVVATATTAAGAAAAQPHLAMACDVRDTNAVQRCVAASVARFGRLDVVINNAGIAGENSLVPADDDERWFEIIDVNLHGTYRVCKAALPHLPDGTGRILNVGSTLSLRGVPEQSAYCAAKHAVLGFTRALALKVASRGITVNAICPGWTETDMMNQRARELGVDAASLGAGVPIGRATSPDEVAAMAVYLASPAASSVTGQALVIDGGSLA